MSICYILSQNGKNRKAESKKTVLLLCVFFVILTLVFYVFFAGIRDSAGTSGYYDEIVALCQPADDFLCLFRHTGIYENGWKCTAEKSVCASAGADQKLRVGIFDTQHDERTASALVFGIKNKQRK
ncbi:MAG: hypothetical protein IKC99_00145 [Clostridia bacterium]|nr:hypothetical protein [Clostridia bacterium]